MNIIVQTPRLIIREFTPGEEDLFVNLYKDDRVARYVPKRTDEEWRAKFHETLGEYESRPGLGRWGAFNPVDGDFIGFCMLRSSDANTQSIELGYALPYHQWGLGLATEISKALITYGFEQKGLSVIGACTLPENIPSINVLLKAGFINVGSVPWYSSDLCFFKIYKG